MDHCLQEAKYLDILIESLFYDDLVKIGGSATVGWINITYFPSITSLHVRRFQAKHVKLITKNNDVPSRICAIYSIFNKVFHLNFVYSSHTIDFYAEIVSPF